MQTANLLLSLNADPGNTVPKYGVTVAEVAVLMQVHGSEAVQNIEPTGEVVRTDAEEIERLLELFPRPYGVPSPVKQVYPGAMARVHRTFNELTIPDQQFKATAFVPRAPVGTEAAVEAEVQRRLAEERALEARRIEITRAVKKPRAAQASEAIRRDAAAKMAEAEEAARIAEAEGVRQAARSLEDLEFLS